MSPIKSRAEADLLAQLLVGTVLAIYGLASGTSLVILLAASVLATASVLGRRSSIALWPVGLAMNLVLAYAVYVWSWVTNTDGISPAKSTVYFIVATSVFGSAATIRLVVVRRMRRVSTPPRGLGLVTQSLLISIPVILVVLVLLRTGTSPERLISAHLGGGDHGPHNEIIHRLIDPTSGSELTSPISVYAYPRAVHYLIGLINVFDNSVKGLPTLASGYVSAAQFEYLQLAAMVQCSLLLVVGPLATFRRTLVALSSIVFVMAIDNYVAHAFWSGFTTSLAVTWILLLSAALARLDCLPRRALSRCLGWLILTILCWITYQPFAAVGGTMILIESMNSRTIVERLGSRGNHYRTRLGSFAVFVVPIGALFLPWALEGSSSPAVTSLLADGAVHRPHLWTVVLVVIGALGGEVLRRTGPEDGQRDVLVSVLGLTVGAILVVRAAGGPGMFDQPYYVQKMFWVLLFIGLPLVIGHVLDLVLEFTAARRWNDWSTVFAICSAAILLPVATGRTPASATRHASVDWFAAAMVSESGANLARSVALFPVDPLGSHLANLALKSQSTTHLPIATSLSGNSYLGCRFVNREPVDVVFTGLHGLSLLAEAGCRLDRKYVIDGELVVPPEPPFTEIQLNTEYRVGNTDIGQFLLFRGVKEVAPWGAELTGYLSAIGIKVPADAVDPAVELKYRPSQTGPADRTVTFGLGGEPRMDASLDGRQWRTTRVPFRDVQPGSKIELTIDCAWSDRETEVLGKGVLPESCIDLATIRVVSGSAQGQ